FRGDLTLHFGRPAVDRGGEELVPRPSTDGPIGREMDAGPDRRGGTPRDRHVNEAAPAARRTPVRPDELREVEEVRPPHGPGPPAPRPPGAPRARWTSRSATSSVSIGWNRKPDGIGTIGSRASAATVANVRSKNCVARRVVHGRPDVAITSSAACFEPKKPNA